MASQALTFELFAISFEIAEVLQINLLVVCTCLGIVILSENKH